MSDQPFETGGQSRWEAPPPNTPWDEGQFVIEGGPEGSDVTLDDLDRPFLFDALDGAAKADAGTDTEVDATITSAPDRETDTAPEQVRPATEISRAADVGSVAVRAEAHPGVVIDAEEAPPAAVPAETPKREVTEVKIIEPKHPFDRILGNQQEVALVGGNRGAQDAAAYQILMGHVDRFDTTPGNKAVLVTHFYPKAAEKSVIGRPVDEGAYTPLTVPMQDLLPALLETRDMADILARAFSKGEAPQVDPYRHILAAVGSVLEREVVDEATGRSEVLRPTLPQLREALLVLRSAPVGEEYGYLKELAGAENGGVREAITKRALWKTSLEANRQFIEPLGLALDNAVRRHETSPDTPLQEVRAILGSGGPDSQQGVLVGNRTVVLNVGLEGIGDHMRAQQNILGEALPYLLARVNWNLVAFMDADMSGAPPMVEAKEYCRDNAIPTLTTVNNVSDKTVFLFAGAAMGIQSVDPPQAEILAKSLGRARRVDHTGGSLGRHANVGLSTNDGWTKNKEKGSNDVKSSSSNWGRTPSAGTTYDESVNITEGEAERYRQHELEGIGAGQMAVTTPGSQNGERSPTLSHGLFSPITREWIGPFPPPQAQHGLEYVPNQIDGIEDHMANVPLAGDTSGPLETDEGAELPFAVALEEYLTGVRELRSTEQERWHHYALFNAETGRSARGAWGTAVVRGGGAIGTWAEEQFRTAKMEAILAHDRLVGVAERERRRKLSPAEIKDIWDKMTDGQVMGNYDTTIGDEEWERECRDWRKRRGL